MRSAVIIGKLHTGGWKLISDPDKNMIEQRTNFRSLRVSKSNDTFSEIRYQESDGHAEILRFLTPEAAAKREEQRAKDHAEWEASMKPKPAAPVKPIEPAAPVEREAQMADSAAGEGKDSKEQAPAPPEATREQERPAPQVPAKPKQVPPKRR